MDLTPIEMVKQFHDFDNVYHISLDPSGGLWVSDAGGKLVYLDQQRNERYRRNTGGGKGYHTATKNRELLFTDIIEKKIKKINLDADFAEQISTFADTGYWSPISIHYSPNNDEILVGMIKDQKAKISIYNSMTENIGEFIMEVDEGMFPKYITKNIKNGYILATDPDRREMVGVNGGGHLQFAYGGQEPGFSPYGVCTKANGEILVCDGHNGRIEVLDHNGEFRTWRRPVGIRPYSVCVDNAGKLYVGEIDPKSIATVTKYKY